MVKKDLRERKITTIKLDRNEWQEHIRKSIRQEHQKDLRKERREKIERAKQYKKYLPVPIIIGILASIIMWKEFSAEELMKTILSWVIGITIVSTILASMRKL